ncbi:2-C-methyl-D-erythritol 4-phosphate cytidylyltransferase [Hathewaya proteolytica DSM 3090]|uniref:2-C-methyl-D-erythritol 4-phosphate cytidylyltransferase n=1 Tax=Hathewaya proteolytica DSM 3090 TaxID=1121331 RepID=A0A1M6PT12_9CLOT|nr:2-C-methyl-D-erythritol 4-phosphate cytidylyltransferase [Hathewaya proteolytica]SHK11087.1 2-C-methyl-D-erythritol 4-phosphate cytidylyltransferase [Hathewaya proteolytica DSM 3090]
MNIAVILAGGSGTRMGSDIPKQFIDIYGKPLIIHTIEAFDINPGIDYIAVMCKQEYKEDLKIWIRQYGISKVKWILDGGSTRQQSVYNSIKALTEFCSQEDILVIHDAARPLIAQRIIDENIQGASEHKAVDTVIPSADTIIKSLDGDTIEEVPRRKDLYLGQTPQSFTFSLIKAAHEYALQCQNTDATDDCQLVLKYGQKVHLVKGDKMNFKVTTFEDLLLLKSIIKLGKLEMN